MLLFVDSAILTVKVYLISTIYCIQHNMICVLGMNIKFFLNTWLKIDMVQMI